MRSNTLLHLAWITLGVALTISFIIDWSNVESGGSIDLRNRVTGSRLLTSGIDPYFYKWHEPEPPKFCDPHNNPHVPVSKTTNTPALLILEEPLAALGYRPAQFIWLIAQWLLLLGVTVIWMPMIVSGWKRWAFAAFVAAFTFTAAWRLHAERGQVYVLYLFLFTAWLRLTWTTKRPLLAGLIAGVLVMLRPPFLLLLPVVGIRRRSQLPGILLGLLLSIALPLFFRSDSWQRYGQAMQQNAVIYQAGGEPRPGPMSFPPEIEGIPTDLLAAFAPIPYADFSVSALAEGLNFLSGMAWPFPLLLLVLFSSWLAWTWRKPDAQILAVLTGWLFLADLFLPAYRNSYNDVIALALVGGLFAQKTVSSRVPLLGAALALATGWAVYYFQPESRWLINMPAALLTVSALLAIAAPRGLHRRSSDCGG